MPPKSQLALKLHFARRQTTRAPSGAEHAWMAVAFAVAGYGKNDKTSKRYNPLTAVR